MNVTKELMPNGELEGIREDLAREVNRSINHIHSLEGQIEALRERQKEALKTLTRDLPYSKGDVLEVIYPNKKAGFDYLRLLGVELIPDIGLEFLFEIIEYRKDGKEKKNLRKIRHRSDFLERTDKTIMEKS